MTKLLERARPDLIAAGAEPEPDCQICPRLYAFRQSSAEREPDWHNRPVATFGKPDARLLIVGLAPGLRGANRTGRPFTGDYAGDLLYQTLNRFGFANDRFDAHVGDGLELFEAAVTNAVRCVPPENKPTGGEIANCRPFLTATIAAHARLKAVVALGRIAHESTLRALGARLKDFPFAHGAEHRMGELVLFDSYHCSRYNTNTGRLTEAMFEDVFRSVRSYLDSCPG